MRIGVMLGATGGSGEIDGLVAAAKQVEAAGLDNLWMANVFSFDAISALALIGRETARLGVGTAVTPTFPRHPTALAQQALTTAAAAGGRFTLGIGLSHKVVIENMLGLSYHRPARHMREYLQVLSPLLRGETVNHQGELFRVTGLTLTVPGAQGVPTVVAALGPLMLRVAGELADGTSTWMVGPKTMANHIVPKLRAAAQAAGRGAPTVVGGLPVVLTNKPEDARSRIARTLGFYGQLPSYRAMLDQEGAAGPADIALVGDEAALRAAIAGFADAGVTDFNAAIAPVEDGAYERTLAFLGSLSF